MIRRCLPLVSLASLAFLLVPGPLARAAAPDLESTALRVLLEEQPDADLRSPLTRETLADRKAELAAIFDSSLTDAGRHAFYQEPPVVLGEVLVHFTPEATRLIVDKLEGKGRTPLPGGSVGLPAVDAVLRRHGATEIERLAPDDDFDVHVSPAENPALVAKELAALPETVKATPNVLNDFNTYSVTRRGLRGGSPVYELSAGWGDCFGGCAHAHKVEFVVTAKGEELTALKTSESGEPLPQELQQRLFTQPPVTPSH